MSDATAIQEQIEELQNQVQSTVEELQRLRRELPPEPVEDYVFHNTEGEIRLAQLFGEQRDLILIHNMGRGCSYCTLWADGFNGLVAPLQDRAALVVVSSDPPEGQQEFAELRGWRFPMASTQGTSFTADMGFVREHDGKVTDWPGCSTFRKQDDGTIVRIAQDVFGPGDAYCSIWHLFALLHDGADGWQPRYDYDA